MDPLRENVNILALHIASLEQQRSSDPFANDVYEAAWYWRDLGNWVLENNTRTNFPARAREELALLDNLRTMLSKKSREERQRYTSLFDAAQEVLRVVETVKPPGDGHLGVLRSIREHFRFLETEYSFAIVREEPIGVRFSSGAVYLELQWANKYASSCTFGPESSTKKSFWIDDLLFMHGDPRYRTLPEELALNTESDVESWFNFLAAIFKQYGREVLSNQSGIFETLEKAQTQRDHDYTQEMDRKHGKA